MRGWMRYGAALLLSVTAAVLLRSLTVQPAALPLVPLADTPWELSKLVFWPYWCGGLLLWRREGTGQLRRGRHCAAALAATALMVTLCKLAPTLPLMLRVSLSTAGGLTLYHALLRRHLPEWGCLWYLWAVLLGAAYLLLAALPL